MKSRLGAGVTILFLMTALGQASLAAAADPLPFKQNDLAAQLAHVCGYSTAILHKISRSRSYFSSDDPDKFDLDLLIGYVNTPELKGADIHLKCTVKGSKSSTYRLTISTENCHLYFNGYKRTVGTIYVRHDGDGSFSKSAIKDLLEYLRGDSGSNAGGCLKYSESASEGWLFSKALGFSLPLSR